MRLFLWFSNTVYFVCSFFKVSCPLKSNLIVIFCVIAALAIAALHVLKNFCNWTMRRTRAFSCHALRSKLLFRDMSCINLEQSSALPEKKTETTMHTENRHWPNNERFDKHKNDYFLTSRNELWFFSKLKFRCKTATEEARCSFVVIRRSAEKKMAAAKIQLDEKRHVNTLPIFKDIQIMHWAFPQRPIRTFRF